MGAVSYAGRRQNFAGLAGASEELGVRQNLPIGRKDCFCKNIKKYSFLCSRCGPSQMFCPSRILPFLQFGRKKPAWRELCASKRRKKPSDVVPACRKERHFLALSRVLACVGMLFARVSSRGSGARRRATRHFHCWGVSGSASRGGRSFWRLPGLFQQRLAARMEKKASAGWAGGAPGREAGRAGSGSARL